MNLTRPAFMEMVQTRCEKSDAIRIHCMRKFRWFNKEIYKDRYKVERTFGWKPDTYRRLVSLSYDKLKETRLGFRNLAYSMINFRITFNTS